MTVPSRTEPVDAPRWTADSHQLSDAARKALSAALGYPDGSRSPRLSACLNGVEYWLGFHAGAVDAVDHAPRTAAIKREIERLRDEALALAQRLDDTLNPYARELLNADRIDDASRAALALAMNCNEVLAALPTGLSGVGRPRAGARDAVLTRLLGLFAEYTRHRQKVGTRSGAFRTLSEYEQHRLDFVRAAFQDIQADPFHDANGRKKWLELIREALAAQSPPQPEKG